MLKKEFRRLLRTSFYKMMLKILSAIFLLSSFDQILGRLGTRDFDHIDRKDIIFYAHKATNPHLNYSNFIFSISECNYNEVLINPKKHMIKTQYIGSQQVPDFSDHGIQNGSFKPEHCIPQFSVAIIVPFRHPKETLVTFLHHMHDFLRTQKIHYRIYIVRQNDDNPFRKGLLFNVGAGRAFADGFPCFVFHEIDVLPIDAANLYICLRLPRHVCALLETNRFVLPTSDQFDGAVAIRSKDFLKLEGYSNWLQGSAVDEEMHANLRMYKINKTRYPPEMSRCAVQTAAGDEASELRRPRFYASVVRPKIEVDARNRGLRNVNNYLLSMKSKVHKLYKLITVVTRSNPVTSATEFGDNTENDVS